MMMWFAVAAGGALGSVARHAVNMAVLHAAPTLRFPLATSIVNVAGCCVFGLLAGVIATGRLPMSLQWREFVFVGILGGFTTFSTFGFETVSLLRAGAPGYAAAGVAAQLCLGVAGLYAGLTLGERL